MLESHLPRVVYHQVYEDIHSGYTDITLRVFVDGLDYRVCARRHLLYTYIHYHVRISKHIRLLYTYIHAEYTDISSGLL